MKKIKGKLDIILPSDIFFNHYVRINANVMTKEVEVIGKKIECPCCSNKRLMDMFSATQAELEIKCPKCGRVIHLSFRDNKIKTKTV